MSLTEQKYKIWTGLPDNKAVRKIKEYCGDDSILGFDKEDGFIVKTTHSKMMKFKNETRELTFVVESREEARE